MPLSERDVIRVMGGVLHGGWVVEDDVWFDEGTGLVVSIDALVGGEDVPPGMGPEDVGWRAVTAAVSDLVCKGVAPLVVNVALTLPPGVDDCFLKGLARGLKAACDYYRAAVGKCDVGRGRELVVAISACGYARRRPPPRSGARPGDRVVVAAGFGCERMALEAMLGELRIRESIREELVRRYLRPVVDVEKAVWAVGRGYVSAAIDSSDGLARSLHEISRASGVGIVVRELPVDPLAAEAAASAGLDLEKYVLYGGEEYTPVFCIRGDAWEEFLREAGEAGYDFKYVGDVVEGSGVYVARDGRVEPLADRGWDSLLGYQP